jgi:hypothetical protein
MTKPEPVRYRTTNWTSCNDALRRLGSLLIWLDKDMMWLENRAGRPGRPPVFSNAVIQFCQMVKVLFGMPLRQTTATVASILKMAGLDWPVRTSLRLKPQTEDACRSEIKTPHVRTAGPSGGQHRDQAFGVKRHRGRSGAA